MIYLIIKIYLLIGLFLALVFVITFKNIQRVGYFQMFLNVIVIMFFWLPPFIHNFIIGFYEGYKNTMKNYKEKG
jgi:hypothetical protein